MKTSQDGLNLIESSEGLRTMPYQDVAGYWSIGYGHKILAGEDFSAGITPSQAQALLQQDLGHVEDAMRQLLPINCTQGQWDACADFGYNLGVNALRTCLGHGFNQFPVQALRWVNAGGKEQPGLVTRRKAEVALFTS
jgi:lysozyme